MRTPAAACLAMALLAGSSARAEEPQHKFQAMSDGVKIHYMEIGRGTPLVLIHGYTANAEGKWFKSGIAQALAARHRVIAIDARGHGQSDKPHDPLKYGPRMAEDVVELMNALKIQKAHVHGYSMGGSILTQLLARHPGRLITAVYGGSGVQESDPKWQAQVPRDPEPPAAGAPGAPRGETWSAYPGYDRAALDAVQKYPWKPEDRAIDLTKVDVPVLAIVGGLDRPNQRTYRLKRELKDFRLVVLPGETHGSAHLNPAYTKTLVEFLTAPGARSSRAVDLDAATIADLIAAFDAGTLTSEKLVQMCLARIEAYDRKGPALRAVITVNPKALETARALDAERKAKGRRSPLHGIPIVLKDNIDTADLATTGGSVLLEGSMPPDDAFLVKKLRAAGAVIVAKTNLSEFASGAAHSSLGGQIRNPHDVTRTPSGSSGGTGAGIAAGYAVVGLGTDTGGSIRGPSTSNGIAGLKPTHGLVSRDGIIPLALSFDTVGPMARSVHDVAASLGVMTGVDPADPDTRKSEGRFETDYTRFLNTGALKGARIGVARDFLGQDADVDWVIEASLDAMRREGATVVDVRFPRWLIDVKAEFYNAIRYPEFVAQVADYLATVGPTYPKTVEQLIDRATRVNAPRPDGAGPNPGRWGLMRREAGSGTLEDFRYRSVRDHGMPLVRAVVDGILTSQKLDAIVYPTSPRRPPLIAAPPEPPGGGSGSPSNIANLSGLPDLIVPAGFTGDDLPVGLSFLGAAFSEPKILALGYSFEQATRARRLPVHTPRLPGEAITIP